MGGNGLLLWAVVNVSELQRTIVCTVMDDDGRKCTEADGTGWLWPVVDCNGRYRIGMNRMGIKTSNGAGDSCCLLLTSLEMIISSDAHDFRGHKL